eukprot:TRINITY_DN11310_c0_g1_i1.p1 TRINITY_DN11310_c0_g1~~TRINITY_DN11310_c0_g1_i1.p1  ORF type:complete len:717 (+),score=171.33 TRINITY_DN11310_c0_g1_i1:116-2266(+)
MAPAGGGLFTEQQVSGKGLGLVATRDLPPGVLLLEEAPLLRLSDAQLLGSLDAAALSAQERQALQAYRDAGTSGGDDPSESQPRRAWRTALPAGTLRDAAEAELTQRVSAALPPGEQRALFESLCDAWAAPGGGTLAGIYETNCLHLAGEGDEEQGVRIFGVFPTVSRINHSCDPNVHGAWLSEAGRWRVRTIRDVPRGAELCTSYLPLEHTRAERQRRLQPMGFSCCCPVCALPPEQLAADDAARVRWGALDAAIAERAEGGDLPGAAAAARELVELLSAPDGPARGAREVYLARACGDAAQLAEALGDTAAALDWARRALQHRYVVDGDCPTTAELRHTVRRLQALCSRAEVRRSLAQSAARLRQYGAAAEAGISAAEQVRGALPARLRMLLPAAPAREAEAAEQRRCAEANATVLAAVAALPPPTPVGADAGAPQALASAPGGSELCVPSPLLSGDVLHAQELMGQMARDWGDDAALRRERQSTFGLLLAALEQCAPSGRPRKEFRVLVPGCGTGRLGVEAAALGFAVDASDAWAAAGLAYRLVAQSAAPGSLELYPYAHRGDNVVATADRSRCVRLPDVLPGALLSADGAGPFTYSIAAYSDFAGGRYCGADYDALLTCFFIDQGPNVLAHVAAAAELLRPGGVWLNFGVLAYHRDAPWGLRLSWDELREGITAAGFTVTEHRVVERTPYSFDERSMLCHLWNPVYFKAVRQ